MQDGATAAKVFQKLFISGTPAEMLTDIERLKTGRSILDQAAAGGFASEWDSLPGLGLVCWIGTIGL